MGAEAAIHLPAVVLVPFPAQGHVTPMLHLARALAAHGVAATVAVPDFVHRRIAGKADADLGDGGGVTLASIPSGIADGDGGDPPGFADFADAMEHHMPSHLERLLTRTRAATGCRVACVVVDVLASWAVPVAERCGVPVAGFWPAMLASYRVVAAIPELMEKGLISESGTACTLLSQFPLSVAGVLARNMHVRELTWRSLKQEFNHGRFIGLAYASLTSIPSLACRCHATRPHMLAFS